jgi:hypothetical protein
MFLRRYAGIAFSLACIAMVSACGSSSTATGSTSTATGSTSTATGSPLTPAASAPAAGGAAGSVCSLVSANDLQSLTGATSATVVSDLGAGTGDSSCMWQLQPSVTRAAIVEVWTGASAELEAPVWARFQADPAVTGVGDEAHWDTLNGALLVKVGTGYASFSVGAANDGSVDQTATTNLAKLVVPKLGG